MPFARHSAVRDVDRSPVRRSTVAATWRRADDCAAGPGVRPMLATAHRQYRAAVRSPQVGSPRCTTPATNAAVAAGLAAVAEDDADGGDDLTAAAAAAAADCDFGAAGAVDAGSVFADAAAGPRLRIAHVGAPSLRSSFPGKSNASSYILFSL